MSILRALAVIALTVTLAGCSNKYRVETYDAPTTRLTPAATFYVAMPADGIYEDIIYVRSGEMTANAIYSELLMHVDQVEIGIVPGQEVDEALEEAFLLGATHLFHASIIHWEDRATEWSRQTDKLTLRLVVYEVASGQEISSTVARASTEWGSLGGDHPQELLPEMVRTFVTPLF